MRYVIALADTGTLTKAGKKLYVSRQIMGKTINQVEERLGTKLFERTGRSVSPTEFGSALILDARQVVEAVDAFNRSYEPPPRISCDPEGFSS